MMIRQGAFLTPQKYGTTMAARMSAAKVPGFRKGGLVDLDLKIHQSTNYMGKVYSFPLSTIPGVGGVIALVFLLRVLFCSHPAVNATEACLSLAG